MVRAAKTLAIDEATRRAQAAASDPRASAWVSANAGAGKTYVLAQRVVRLLLSGSDPGRILCLTFTKAAAAEMAKRVFQTLADWTRLDDAGLTKKIAEIEGRRPLEGELAIARRLFARALETPGGLKIQTIHAFCERLLHQFPFEANVAGHFEVLDEREQTALADEARRSVLAEAARDPNGRLGRALAAVLEATSDPGQEATVAEFVRRRDRIRAWTVRAHTLEDALTELRAGLGVGAAETSAGLRREIVGGSLLAGLGFAGFVELLAQGGTNDCKAAERLRPILGAANDEEALDAYLAFWMTLDERPKLREASLVSKTVKNRLPGLDTLIDDERARLEALLDEIRAAECYETTAAMLTLADAAIAEYDRRKRIRGALDFEDLIVRTANLLRRADAASWVHYKLDRGIEHILVDEAQDTNPRQWEVVRTLVAEFFAGAGASERTRTLFAVGDEKQSIYSFQGAVHASFSETRRVIARQVRDAALAWAEPSLHLSFRSVPVVLSAVDRVFSRPAAFGGLSEETVAPVHAAARMGAPGRVVVWPMIEPPEKKDPPDWWQPVDHLSEKSPEVRLAERIARTIGGWKANKEKIEATGEPVRDGSILILARTRGVQTDAINRALKSRGIAIAGADRLAITDHIAIMDLMALGRVMLLPDDDLSLAAVLKSPLLGLSEDDLFAIAHQRPHTLWDALGLAAVTRKGIFAEARGKLDEWRKRADYLDPHAFFARILGPDRGRKQFIARLGAEAEDVLEEFLAQALAFERSHVPSLEGFLSFLDTARTEVRRDTDTLRDEVRVMTVHGAKGLEADIVFLVDTGMRPWVAQHDPKILSLADDRDGSAPPVVWMRGYRSMPEVVKARVDAVRAQSAEEYRRLLYVAMTRARDRLYVCGTLKQTSDAAGGWHALVSDALRDEWTRADTPEGEAYEWRAEPRRPMRLRDDQAVLPLRAVPPPWLDMPAPPPPPLLKRLVPSAIRDEEDIPAIPAFARRSWIERRLDPDSAAALQRGRLVHRLLQSLPDIVPGDRAVIGARYLAAAATAWPDEDRTRLLAEVMAILSDPGFAPVFAPGSRAEVDVAGLLPSAGGAATISGRIDRLAVAGDRVLIVDYKTNRPAPVGLEDTPAPYLAQLAVYRDVLVRLYSGKTVAAAILWTDRPALMEIPSSTLDAALAKIVANAGTDGQTSI